MRGGSTTAAEKNRPCRSSLRVAHVKLGRVAHLGGAAAGLSISGTTFCARQATPRRGHIQANDANAAVQIQQTGRLLNSNGGIGNPSEFQVSFSL